MILTSSSDEMDLASYQTIVMPGSAVIKRYRAGNMEIRIHRMPRLSSDSAVIAVPLAATAHIDGRYLFEAGMECDDLRAMAPLMGTSLKELQADYGVKGFYGPMHISLYGEGEKESLGEYLGEKDDDSVTEFLLSLVLDTFDEIAEPEEIQNPR